MRDSINKQKLKERREWIDWGDDEIECPECGAWYYIAIVDACNKRLNYCPNCGEPLINKWQCKNGECK